MSATPLDTATFVARYEEAAPALLAWAALRLGPALRKHFDPEDLVQETGCRAFERRATFDPDAGTFRAWLFGIAHNVLRHALRRLATRPGRGSVVFSDDSRELLASLPERVTSVSRRAARSEDVQRLLEHAARLSADERKLLALRGLIGLDHAEVARRIGVGVSAAEKRWQRLRDRLADAERVPPFLAG